MISREQVILAPRTTLSKIFVQALLIPALVLWATAAVAQDDDFNVHIQPRRALLAQAQTAQQPAESQPQDQPQPPNTSPSPLIVPAGTRLPLVLARPLSVKHARPGDTAYLQTTFPISAGGQMAIPPGTFLQGTIDKITRRDRLQRVLAFDLRSAQIIFSTGYTVSIPGPLQANPVLARSVPPGLSDDDSVPVLAATGGPTPPPLPPLPGAGTRNVLIGVGVAVAVGSVVAAVVFAHRTDILMRPGTSMEAVLTAPLSLDQNRVMLAVQQYAAQTATAPPQIPQAPPMGTCWTAGTPGTPDTIIPGTAPTIIPGTPDITIPGDPPTVIPGTPAVTIPGTPDTVIPGIAGTDPTPYPCPK